MSARRAQRLPPLLLALILTSCATTGTGAIDENGIATVCSVWPYVSWSSRDTPETIADAKANNAAKTGFCGTAATGGATPGG
jgi:hypothetical protein